MGGDLCPDADHHLEFGGSPHGQASCDGSAPQTRIIGLTSAGGASPQPPRNEHFAHVWIEESADFARTIVASNATLTKRFETRLPGDVEFVKGTTGNLVAIGTANNVVLWDALAGARSDYACDLNVLNFMQIRPTRHHQFEFDIVHLFDEYYVIAYLVPGGIELQLFRFTPGLGISEFDPLSSIDHETNVVALAAFQNGLVVFREAVHPDLQINTWAITPFFFRGPNLIADNTCFSERSLSLPIYQDVSFGTVPRGIELCNFDAVIAPIFKYNSGGTTRITVEGCTFREVN